MALGIAILVCQSLHHFGADYNYKMDCKEILNVVIH